MLKTGNKFYTLKCTVKINKKDSHNFLTDFKNFLKKWGYGHLWPLYVAPKEDHPFSKKSYKKFYESLH